METAAKFNDMKKLDEKLNQTYSNDQSKSGISGRSNVIPCSIEEFLLRGKLFRGRIQVDPVTKLIIIQSLRSNTEKVIAEKGLLFCVVESDMIDASSSSGWCHKGELQRVGATVSVA